MDNSSTSQRISPKVIGAIIAAGLMSFCGVVVETATNITFPTLMSQFKISTGTVQWMTTIYLLAVAIIVPLSAILKRSFRTKSLFIFANLAFIIGLIIDGLVSYKVPSFSVLLIGRVIQGVGTGIALPLMFNIILEEVPKSKIGMMMGVGALITAIAPAVGPTFGGLTVSTLSWHFIFIFLLPILVISLILGITTIQKEAKPQTEKFDVLSIIWIAVMFIGLVFGFSSINTNLTIAIVAIVVGCVATYLLFHRSNHIDDPIIHLNVMKDLNFSGHTLAFFSLQLLTLGFSFILPNYLQLVNHKSAFIAGLICLPGAVIGAIFAPFSGRLLDRFGARKPILTGSGIMLIALILFVIFGKHLSNGMILSFYFIYMISVGLSFGNLMTDGLKQLPLKRQADGNAIFNTLMQLAGAVSTSIVSTIIAQAQMSGGASKATLTASGSEHALIFMLILTVVEAVSAFKVVKH